MKRISLSNERLFFLGDSNPGSNSGVRETSEYDKASPLRIESRVQRRSILEREKRANTIKLFTQRMESQRVKALNPTASTN
jgi:hypothetical protein